MTVGIVSQGGIMRELFATIVLATGVVTASAATPGALEPVCTDCHGAQGTGGDRAPPLADSARVRALSDAQLRALIRSGTPGGMPAFPYADATLDSIVAWLRAANPVDIAAATPEQIRAGERYFFGAGGCAACHAVRGRGASNGPDLSTIAARTTRRALEAMLDDPTSQLGAKTTTWCPGWAFCPDLQWSVVSATLRDGTRVRGFARAEGEHDLVLQIFDGRFVRLGDAEIRSLTRERESYMPRFGGTPDERRDVLAYLQTLARVPLGPAPPGQAAAARVPYDAAPQNWPTYDGAPRGNRYSPLASIHRGNVSRLTPRWTFAPGGAGLQTTPVVIDGVMYVTGAARICALDAGTGRQIWCAPRVSGQSLAPGIRERRVVAAAEGAPAPFGGPGLANGPNRGVAVSGDRVFFVSDDAYLVCLNRITGGTIWIQQLADPRYPGSYYNSAAPLVVGERVIAGVAGGDGPIRGFLAAYRVDTGELDWRFWTIPAAGEPGSETWPPEALATGGGGTWTTGSYDADTRTLYWAVGNPYPSTNGGARTGRNLYTNSVVALDVATGAVRWSYQFTPHDVHDWDANAPLVLANASFDGRPRRLLLQANRNGFFYVLDRDTGEFLRATPFVNKLTWARGVGADGVPVLAPGQLPSEAGTLTCPSVRGATNWYGTAFDPATRRFFVMAAEDCSVYRTSGAIFGGWRDPADPSRRFLRALDLETGKIVWEKPLAGAQEANYSGVLATAGGLVFHGETGGRFAAVDARSGRTSWTFAANEFPRATPMTYEVDGRQFVAVAMGASVIAFSLP